MKEKSLYCSLYEKDACGIGFVANFKGEKSHSIVSDALQMLENMEHRGGVGSDPDTGDGAGVMMQISHSFFSKTTLEIGIDLPEEGKYGVGMIFFPADVKTREKCRFQLNIILEELGFELLGYRDVPVNYKSIGETALLYRPKIEQMFIRHTKGLAFDDLERKLFVLRTYTTNYINKHILNQSGDFYFTSCSYKTIIYKGQFRTFQLQNFYPDLKNEGMESAFAMVHSRFSTNTFPRWKLAQPFRYISHNGEINTIQGNVNWMRSNETLIESSLFEPEDIQRLKPILDVNNSDSANLDLMIEILVMGGRSLPHTLMMLIPEAWEHSIKMSPEKKAFYEYHASMMEPWDGPAAVCFSDGKTIGATLDRNGLRPARYVITNDNRIILASEAGALEVPTEIIVKKGRLQPGKMFYADLEEGRIVYDKEIKTKVANRKPYAHWLKTNQVKLAEMKEKPSSFSIPKEELLRFQQIFGYSREDLNYIIRKMSINSKEPLGSMGADIPLAVLSGQSQHLSNYFKQQFAQVSNPPIDPIRERQIMSLGASVGIIHNLLSETPVHCKQIIHPTPVLTNSDLEKLRDLQMSNFRVKTLNIVFKNSDNEGELEKALDDICKQADSAIIDEGYNILLLSDREVDENYAPIPSLLAVGAIHQHLVNNGLRVRIGIVVEAGDVCETHHFGTLIGYGANMVNPYMVFESIKSLKKHKDTPKDFSNEKAFQNYIKAVNLGLLKILSKMGISTLQSYHGAQIFESIGISNKVIEKCFKGTPSKLDGIDFDGIAREVLVRQRMAFPLRAGFISRLSEGGIYKWRLKGEKHRLNPNTIKLLQRATREENYELFKEYVQAVNNDENNPITIRSLLDFKTKTPVPIDEVEAVENIMKRFATGAMSFGSISYEAHSTLAIAMNRIGAKSNSGEGGEDERRYILHENGDSERSAIKQVASGRFGVTSYYLANADEIQIKMAQGAKPGEGGHLPGYKVNDWIGKVRHSTPGVGLISPPPHHDIYSIEDLAQLIYDLKNANHNARINVKLVSKSGVGTIAAGVAKAHADAILISGHDGGTGASPVSSIYHAGTAWEMGLSETHQTLVKNNLRNRVVLQTDGQLRSGRDIAIAAMLGAEEWGVATAALVTLGCVMMRKCHSNTCPVGVATQDEELRKLFTGKPEYVINMFRFLAQDLREIMAELGFRTVNEMVGRTDFLKVKENIESWKLKSLDLSPILYKDENYKGALHCTEKQNHEIQKFHDWKIIEKIDWKKPKLELSLPIKNTDRAVATLLSSEISTRFGEKGLKNNSIKLKFTGSAGQSFGAFATKGISLELIGEANDYIGKGLSGAKISVAPPPEATFNANENVIIGNVAFYGATSGEAYINGVAGERFCVRNSGAKVVVEGVGRHGCEYMTGGTVVILGNVGTNFGAGMSGGIAYIYDPDKRFAKYKSNELSDYEKVSFNDEDELRNYISKHYKNTKSEIAKFILDNWNTEFDQFLKVFPEEYRKALQKLEKSKETELSILN